MSQSGVDSSESAGRAQPQRFDVLLVGHRPTDPPEATLVLAAAAALSGLTCDGDKMPGATGKAPSLNAIANELGLHRGAVRRGLEHLAATGAAQLRADGVHVEPAAMRERWASHRHRLRLSAGARALGMRAEPLLLAGLVAGQLGARGQLQLGLGYLGERTGFARRTLQRALQRAEDAGALHRWTAPIGGGRLIIALGLSRSGARVASRSGARADDSHGAAEPTCRETAHEENTTRASRSGATPVARRRTPCRVPAPPLSQSGALPPEYPPDVHPDHPPDARERAREPDQNQTPPQPAAGDPIPAAPAAEPRPEPSPEPVKQAPAPAAAAATIATRAAAVERWVAAFARRGIEQLEQRHAMDVAGLIDLVGPTPDTRGDPKRSAALRHSRLEMAHRVIRWCRSPERLGRWLLRVQRWFRVENLAGYLRRASERGDPGTVLEGGAKARLGRGAEDVRDFSAATERALVGPYRDQVRELLALGGRIVTETDPEVRDELRAELRRLCEHGQSDRARSVLLRLVGSDPSDVELQRVVAGVLPLAAARRLIA